MAAAGHYCLPVRPGACLALLWRRAAAANSAAAPGGPAAPGRPPCPAWPPLPSGGMGRPTPVGGFCLGPPCPAPGVPAAFTAKESVTFALAPPLPEMVSVSPYLPARKPGFGPDGKLCRGIRGKGGGAARKARSCRNGVICAGGKIDGYALIARVGDGYGLRRGRRRIAPGDGAEIQQCRGGGDIICLRRHGRYRLRFCRRPAWWR